MTYQSPLLNAAGVRHAFSTRHGGVSAGPFTSLNLGNPQLPGPQDDLANLQQNYDRLQQAVGLAGARRAWARQVHGRAVEMLEREAYSEYGETLEAELRDRFSGQLSADGLVTDTPGVALTIRVADCAAILLASTDGRIVAALHAGWRGVVGNIAERGVRVMTELGAKPADIVAAIGPCISTQHFEVGPEVAETFVQNDLAAAVHHDVGPKPHIDLQHAIALQLNRAGVLRVDTNDLCTVRDATDFYSHRRDNGNTGRLAAIIAPTT